MAPSAVEVEAPSITQKSLPIVGKHEELKSPSSPLPEVKSFDASTCTVDELVSALKVAGGLVVRGLLNEEELASLEKDTRPWLEKDTPWDDGQFCDLPAPIDAHPPFLNRRLLPPRDPPCVCHGKQIEGLRRTDRGTSALERRHGSFVEHHVAPQLGE